MNKITTYVHDGGRIGDGFSGEKLDCAVRAYAIAKEIPYTEAHDLFVKAGRKYRHTTGWDVYDRLGIKFTFESCQEVYINNRGQCRYKRMTVSKFIELHPKGSFYVCKRGHAFAIKNGVVFDDRKLSGKTVITKWFEVK